MNSSNSLDLVHGTGIIHGWKQNLTFHMKFYIHLTCIRLSGQRHLKINYFRKTLNCMSLLIRLHATQKLKMTG